MTTVVLDLPFPPSANAIWRNVGARTLKSKRYREWETAAGWDIKAQKPGKVQGPYELELIFERKDGRKRDIGNLEKAVSDLLQTNSIIENDCMAQKITMYWGDVKGCRVVVREAIPLQAEGSFKPIGLVATHVLETAAEKMRG